MITPLSPPGIGGFFMSSHTLRNENKQTLKLAFPMMASYLGQMLLGLADTVMIGQLGTVELAAVAFMNTLIHLIMASGIGLAVGVGVEIARAHGAKAHEAAAEALRHGLVLAASLGLLIWALLIFLQPAFHLLGQPAEVMQLLPPYLKWVAPSLAFMIPIMVLKSFSESKNHPWPVFWIQIAGVALNIGLNALLIFGNLGFPELGLAGAGLATCLSRILTLLAMWFYLRASHTLAEARPTRWLAPLSRKELLRLFSLALPISAQMLMEFGAFTVSALFIGRLGPLAMAAHQIAITCAATTYMIPLGLSGALGIRVGHLMGAGDSERCRRVCLGTQLMTLGIMGSFALLYLSRGTWIAGIFTEDPELIALSSSLFLIAGLFQIFDGLQVVSMGALRALKDVIVPSILSLIGYWVISFPLGLHLCFQRGWGVRGFWTSLGLGLFLSSCSLGLRLWKILWRSSKSSEKSGALT